MYNKIPFVVLTNSLSSDKHPDIGLAGVLAPTSQLSNPSLQVCCRILQLSNPLTLTLQAGGAQGLVDGGMGWARCITTYGTIVKIHFGSCMTWSIFHRIGSDPIKSLIVVFESIN